MPYSKNGAFCLKWYISDGTRFAQLKNLYFPELILHPTVYWLFFLDLHYSLSKHKELFQLFCFTLIRFFESNTLTYASGVAVTKKGSHWTYFFYNIQNMTCFFFFFKFDMFNPQYRIVFTICSHIFIFL